MLKIDEATLLKELNKKRKEIESPNKVKNSKLITSKLTENNKKLEVLELELLRLLLNYGNEKIYIDNEEICVSSLIISELEIDKINFENPNHAKLLLNIKDHVNKNGNVNIDFFINHQESIFNQLSVDLISNEHNISSNWQ